MVPATTLPDGYGELLEQLKREIGAARTRAALAVNTELIGLYWRIGREIVGREGREGWGAKVVPTLSRDLRSAFPEMSGLAERNLRYMRDFARCWPDWAMLPQAVAKLPWGHVRCLLDKVGDQRDAQVWYATRAVAEGWSRRLLEHHLATGRFEREGAALTNFQTTLSASEGELVRRVLQDDYSLQFLGLTSRAKEAEVERSLVGEIERFMLELGAGFAFVGRQVRLEVAGEEFFIDLLFFHIPLNRYVVIELKLGKFRPEHAGQINFYVSAVDRQIRDEHHGATIGLVLCASRNRTIARYALDGIDRPVGVARYGTDSRALVREVPRRLHGRLPELEQISAGVQEIVRRHAEEIEEE